MAQIINLREANQHLSKYIRSLQEGDEIIITRRGQAVAKLVPMTEEKTLNSSEQEALQRILKLKSEGFHLGGDRIKRDDLYE